MTREEAIRELKQFSGTTRLRLSANFWEALDMAIKALEQESCEDAISRRAVLNTLDKMDSVLDEDRTVETYKELLTACYNDLPSVTPAHKTEWIPVSERLPMEFEFVNCTCHSLIDDREDWVVETVYIPQPSDSPYSDWGNIPMLNSGDCEVLVKPSNGLKVRQKVRNEMTREEAIVMQKAMRDNLHETGKDYPYMDDMIPLMKESCDMAIKALEQESILDKIRAEIQKLRGCSCSCSDGIIDDVEDILDKLIESEREE